MKDILDCFCNFFPTIDFDIKRKPKKHQLSIESRNTGEREIERMLSEAKRALSKVIRSHRKGKASAEEVLDHEFRVHELEEELQRFKDSTDIDDIDLGDIDMESL